MPKTIAILAATLMLVLVAAQLALAQQDTGTTQPVQAEQPPASDPAQQHQTGQQDASQAQPAGEGQASIPGLDGLMRLNENNNLVINCEAVSERLAQLNQLGQTQANDPQFQPALARIESLAQLCADSGFTPSGAGGSATPTTPADGGSTTPTTPPAEEASDTSNPSSTG